MSDHRTEYREARAREHAARAILDDIASELDGIVGATLHEHGYPTRGAISAAARELGVDEATVRRHLRRGQAAYVAA